jgi:hypothetical protein
MANKKSVLNTGHPTVCRGKKQEKPRNYRWRGK